MAAGRTDLAAKYIQRLDQASGIEAYYCITAAAHCALLADLIAERAQLRALVLTASPQRLINSAVEAVVLDPWLQLSTAALAFASIYAGIGPPPILILLRHYLPLFRPPIPKTLRSLNVRLLE